MAQFVRKNVSQKKIKKSSSGNLSEQHNKTIKKLLANDSKKNYYKYFNDNSVELLDYYSGTVDKATILNRYSRNNSGSSYNGKLLMDEINCENCGAGSASFTQQETYDICNECGHSSYALICVATHTNYTNNNTVVHEVDKAQFTYEKKYHFKDLLSQFQGKEAAVIPDEIIEKLNKEFVKHRIAKKDIYKQDIRNMLKKLDLPGYYDHTAFILNIINPANSIVFPIEIENKLQWMFDVLQEPYNIFCPHGRKNILNYNYLFFKFCQILELEKMNIEYTDHLTILKCQNKIADYEKAWIKIIKYINDQSPRWDDYGVNWRFIPLP